MLKNKIANFVQKKLGIPYIRNFNMRQQINRKPITVIGCIEPVDFNNGDCKVVSKLDILMPGKLPLIVSDNICINNIWYKKSSYDEAKILEDQFKSMEIKNPGRKKL